MAPCFAPKCKSGYDTKEKTHTFRPHNSVAQEWVTILSKIRSDTKFNPKNDNHRLCYKHFDPSLLITEEFIQIKGEKISLPKQKWKLQDFAIPTLFPGLPSYRQMPFKKKRPLLIKPKS